jgi:hypothetical protein
VKILPQYLSDPTVKAAFAIANVSPLGIWNKNYHFFAKHQMKSIYNKKVALAEIFKIKTIFKRYSKMYSVRRGRAK